MRGAKFYHRHDFGARDPTLSWKETTKKHFLGPNGANHCSALVIEPVHPGSSSILLVQEHPVELIAERENNSFVVIETHQKHCNASM